MTFSEDGPLSRVTYRLGFNVEGSRPLGMNPIIMTPKILSLDRGPADGTPLSFQCYSSNRLLPPKNLSASNWHFSRLHLHLAAGSPAAISEVDDLDDLLGILPIFHYQRFGQSLVSVTAQRWQRSQMWSLVMLAALAR